MKGASGLEAQALTNLLYSGESFDSRIGQQYLRARWYQTEIGRFARLDPFFGNADDPLSWNKYGYVHGDPVSGSDPTGEFLSSMISGVIAGFHRSANAASSFATYLHIQVTFNAFRVNAKTLWLVGYNALTLAAFNSPTRLPKVDIGSDVLQLGLEFMSAAASSIEHLSAQVERDLNSTKSATKQGQILENATPANFRGTVKGIDDVRFNSNQEAFVTSIRSHDVKDANSLLVAIKRDANELYDKSRRPMFGS